VDSKLHNLAAEKKGLVSRLESLGAISSDNLDPEVILQQGRAALQDLARLMEFGCLEERKEFIRAFVTGVTVLPDEKRLEVRVRKIPASVSLKPGSSVEVVAGARFNPLQTNLIIRSIPLKKSLLAGNRAA
jgi:hypothetical protein